MPGSWEILNNPSILIGILHTDATTLAWSVGLRNLKIPNGAILPVAGMPFDHARNSICQKALEAGVDYCLRGDSLIETIKGGIEIKDVKEGDKVLTHEGRYRKVTKKYVREYKQRLPLYWVRTEYGVVKCTPEHPFWVERNGTRNFIRADEVKAGDVCLYPSKYKMDMLGLNIKFNTCGEDGNGKKGSIKNGQEITSIPVTKDIARFLGLYLAEGCSCSSGIHMTFSNEEKDLHDFVAKMAKVLFGRKPTIISRWATSVSINVRSLGKKFREWFGPNARKKRIPEFVFGWNLENKLSFIKGYLEGDGSFCVHRQSYQYRTASPWLASGLKRLLSSCGMSAGCSRVEPRETITKEGATICSTVAYQGRLTKYSTAKMFDLLEAERDGDYLRISIREVIKKRMPSIPEAKDQVVYNLEVEEDNSFIAGSTIVHNCGFLDSDVIPPPDAYIRLMAHRLPIVSGVYHRRSHPVGVPVMIKNGTWYAGYPKNSLVEVDLVGAGLMVIHRSVLTSIPPLDPDLGRNWFSWRVDRGHKLPPGEGLSEDFAYNLHCRRHGYKIIVDTSIISKHVGNMEVTENHIAPLETPMCN